ncbi:GntR family transcriptional regulator [Paenibacillus xylaniclasticus]|uniref:GntR family transcriptional regulator n=1 Tax=Paenibacillus xylaniclasticus TaxID=588083 RepID=UPI000FDC1233|nr:MULTISPECIES: GntR family transcriptional regulator [Paenibacillus]GFN31470.1 GntR family transcriptional regulator [Paenibacillus curdlanolyticus]
MIISLQLDSETPIYEQLRNQIVIGIATGQLEPGERLPTVRQLAEDLGINTMTVNKAYSLLKLEGYIVIDRRHGAKVSPRKTGGTGEQSSTMLVERLELIIAQATINGMERAQFDSLCDQIFARMKYSSKL